MKQTPGIGGVLGFKSPESCRLQKKINDEAQKSRYVTEKQKERSRKNWIGDIDDMLCEDNLEEEHIRYIDKKSRKLDAT